MSALKAISPIDGRYEQDAMPLRDYFSEQSLMRYRIIVEGEYLIALSEEKGIGPRRFSVAEKKAVRSLYDLDDRGAAAIKKIESVTNHDVKSVEYYLKDKLKSTSLADSLEWIHFALTSEDTNNLAYGLMLTESGRDVLIPVLEELLAQLDRFSTDFASLPMLARTHGQSASPTTLGKEFNVFASRLRRQVQALRQFAVLVKLNGATGNYNAQLAAYPRQNWLAFSKRFIRNLAASRRVRLVASLVTTQIEPHDTYAELFDIIRRINTIIIDFDQDMWRYISDDWIVQRPKEGEVGSSTMPHKINPINFEKSEGNLGIANALLSFFSLKLPVARLQRDLSDSTVERNFGPALAHSLIGWQATLSGLARVAPNPLAIAAALAAHPEVLAEAIQVILRRVGAAMPYEQLKELTRGRKITKDDLDQFVDKLPVAEAIKKEIKHLSVEKYIGLAERLAKMK